MENKRASIGMVIRASLINGVEMKLHAAYSSEQMKAGRFLVIEGETYDFFTIISDIRHATTNPQTLENPPDFTNDLVRLSLLGTTVFTIVSLKCMLIYDKVRKVLEPPKTIPTHFSQVAEAGENDIEIVFGNEGMNGHGENKYFMIGTPLDMSHGVCLDLARFVERSSAVFGRTGTGKTFITRLLLAGFIKTRAAVNLVFDMHNEYGTSGTSEARGGSVKGLQPLFAASGLLKVYSLDPDNTRARGSHCDKALTLFSNDIEPEDILLLQEELRLNPTAAEYSNILKQNFKDNWLSSFLSLMKAGDESIKQFCMDNRLLVGSLDALYRRLNKLADFKFIDFEPDKRKIIPIKELISDLQKGTSVVVEFGRYDNMTAYLLVANVITRQIEREYKEKTEVYLSSKKEVDKPKQLVITIEEAHKFLNPRSASQTSFGKIARELRKYFVSLLIVDQRPSSIDDEILSQIGTKIVAALSDDKDINAVLSGVSQAGGMKSILASLDPKQQALILGHGTPMPVVVRTRDYDDKFYTAMGESKEIKSLGVMNDREIKTKFFPS
ncbi:hypothetical protein CHS0354_023777 [Potamilus streckersoni]|uniref:Helicase HerA central domain-containing protein n=1 Tax=Potamilus streckersoni TaxID=2493646 RepID=A0AAE0VL26_9BIVA|nr:hypothetical protein CHS0354_023777 [Potamilus streckersoni]